MTGDTIRPASASAAMVLLCACAVVRLASAPDERQQLARDLLAVQKLPALAVTSPAFQAGQAIPAPYSQEADDFSPALGWQNPPAATRSFAVLLEDPDAKEPRPFVHWTIYNVPAAVTGLHESIPNLPQLPDLGRARQGRNSRGTIGYVGPRPPHGDAAHHYHFEVFALDAVLPVDPGAPREAVLAAMKGHVVAAGEIIGTFRSP